MAELWWLGYVGGFIPQTPWKKLAVAGKPWLKPIYPTNSEQLRLRKSFESLRTND